MKNQRGITLISLVITIVVLIILAGVAINMTLGENGIFKKAQEAKRLQEIATAKEQIGLEILEAQIEAIDNNEELGQEEVEEIVAKYGVLQADGDTIVLNNSGYEVSLKDIYNTMAEAETDGDTTTELAQLKALLSQTTVTEDKILKDYKAYKDGRIITGTMENYAGQTVSATQVTESGENAEITIPQAGYYDTTSKISVPVSNINGNSGSCIDNYNISFESKTEWSTGYSTQTRTYTVPSGTYLLLVTGITSNQVNVNSTASFDFSYDGNYEVITSKDIDGTISNGLFCKSFYRLYRVTSNGTNNVTVDLNSVMMCKNISISLFSDVPSLKEEQIITNPSKTWSSAYTTVNKSVNIDAKKHIIIMWNIGANQVSSNGEYKVNNTSESLLINVLGLSSDMSKNSTGSSGCQAFQSLQMFFTDKADTITSSIYGINMYLENCIFVYEL